MTDSKTHIAALIDAVIAGKTDSIESAKLAVQQKTVEILNPPAVVETANLPPTTQAPANLPQTTQAMPTTTQAPVTRQPAATTRAPVTESTTGEAGGIVADWTQRFSKTDNDRPQIMRDLVSLVDMGEVPNWLVERYAASQYAEQDKEEPGSLALAFGADTGFIKYLNSVVPNSGNELLKIWDAEHYGIGGE